MHSTTIVLHLYITYSRYAIWFIGEWFADSATVVAVKAAMLYQLAINHSTEVALHTVLVSD